MIKARAISYRANVMYLSSQDQFVDGREAFIRAAQDLYGVCSTEAIEVGKAFFAVGVGPALGNKYTMDVCGVVIPPVPNNSYSAIKSVESGGQGCNTSITPNGTGFTMHAGFEVVYKDGFLAPTGSNLQAYTRECDYTKY